jgi:hypothetical protein
MLAESGRAAGLVAGLGVAAGGWEAGGCTGGWDGGAPCANIPAGVSTRLAIHHMRRTRAIT